jgi:hypothetical protein
MKKERDFLLDALGGSRFDAKSDRLLAAFGEKIGHPDLDVARDQSPTEPAEFGSIGSDSNTATLRRFLSNDIPSCQRRRTKILGEGGTRPI